MLIVGLVLLLRSVARSLLLSRLVAVFLMDQVVRVRVALLCQHLPSFPLPLAPLGLLSLPPSILHHL